MFSNTDWRKEPAASQKSDVSTAGFRVDITCLVAGTDMELEERRIKGLMPATCQSEQFACAITEETFFAMIIEAAIASVLPTPVMKRRKLDILYVCEGSLGKQNVDTLTFPVYRLCHGDLDLRDVSGIKARAKFDMIVIARGEELSPGYKTLKSMARLALKPQKALTAPTRPGLFPELPTPASQLWPAYAAA